MKCNFSCIFLVTFLFLHEKVTLVTCSKGDSSWIFQRCLSGCLHKNCTNMKVFASRQPLSLKITGWHCEDECKYTCMWYTVDAYQKDSQQIPQFYGKWPFVRFFGIQEPASAIFSLFNALTHMMIFKFRARVPSVAPMYYVWHSMAVISAHAWFWSLAFHTRDTAFTEMMDYFCAFSLILYNLFLFFCRVVGTQHYIFLSALFIGLLSFCVRHFYYMAYVKFDYTYNVYICSCIGFLQSMFWGVWCYIKRREQYYVWKCVVVLCLTNVLLCLELGDFPPLLWIVDAHALWHLGTVPLCILWYSFLIDDTLYLLKKTKLQGIIIPNPMETS
ncbi:Hypothetical predicted protein [Octopus vulgaris]|uniref:Post-GPI attachment to proteins factor 3 n=1 Tax=Octopus vulgaris TaxID=6645 RepID=A0AA36ATQ6_OCTVU|nr:Hypothetical predicted protein [Octopus vulgaris]